MALKRNNEARDAVMIVLSKREHAAVLELVDAMLELEADDDTHFDWMLATVHLRTAEERAEFVSALRSKLAKLLVL